MSSAIILEGVGGADSSWGELGLMLALLLWPNQVIRLRCELHLPLMPIINQWGCWPSGLGRWALLISKHTSEAWAWKKPTFCQRRPCFSQECLSNLILPSKALGRSPGFVTQGPPSPTFLGGGLTGHCPAAGKLLPQGEDIVHILSDELVSTWLWDIWLSCYLFAWQSLLPLRSLCYLSHPEVW